MVSAGWALVSLWRVRHDLKRRQLDQIVVPLPPRLVAESRRGVFAALTRGRATCLERSLVLQAWHAARGAPREVVIGVRPPGEDFVAHAWLEGDEPCAEGAEYAEILRLPPHARR